MFITLEGGEGAGKTTQIQNVSNYLTAAGIAHILSREPGGCDSALEIRKLVVEGDPDRWDGFSELLLYNTARHEHLRRVIRPALEKGTWVVCDRFADSTIVYQSHARGVPLEMVENITNLVVGDTQPNLTLFLDIDPAEGLKRARGPRLGFHEDRFEREALEFHQKLRAGFHTQAEKNSDRFRIIDADASEDVVFERIKPHLDALLP